MGLGPRANGRAYAHKDMALEQLLETLGGKQRKIKIDQGLRTLDNICQLYSEILNEYGTHLKAVEHEMIDRCAYLEPDGQRALNITRRILQAIDQRLTKLNGYTFFESLKLLEEVTKLAESPIALDSDYLNQLSTERAHPPVAIRELRSRLDELFDRMKIIRRQQVF
jgi:hypothetical protein